ncbi:transposase [Streptomyces sp. NPDC050856]|uniref:transposase n=1 Tax=Streptomyces sp. NPDC050856 TaxID=3154939 RepID=UPI0033C0FF80
MVLGCTRGTAPAGRAALPVGFGDQGGVGAGRGRRDSGRCQIPDGQGSLPGLRELVGASARFLPAVSSQSSRGRTVSGAAAAVRRFTCEDASCGRRAFAEQVTGLTRRHSQRTERMRSALAEVGLAVAGRAGARLADVFGARVSRNAVLRLVDALPEPQPQPLRVAGVDEYAMRKGRVYRTVLVDIETRRPVDLLPDREAGTPAAWLTEHPGSEVVCRDRAPFFAEGASTGAPTAVQVADRFISGATSAKPRNGASPAIVLACARPPWILPRRRQRLRHRRTAARHGRPDTGSPTAPGPSTPPSTRCWPPATAGAPFSASLA